MKYPVPRTRSTFSVVVTTIACALLITAGCNVEDDGVSVGPGNGEANNGGLDAGNSGNSGNSGNAGNAGNAGNSGTPDMGSMGPCSPGDLTNCPAVDGATPTACNTSGSTPFCTYTCEVGKSDLNGDLGMPGGDGCESDCTISEGGVEVCDGRDNNCDGQVDEGFSVGDACSEGTGVCEAMGTIVCLEDGTSSCDAAAGTPENEVCDGLDNDCDGDVDEDNPGSGGSCDTGLDGACGAGVETCSGGMIICEQTVQSMDEACGADNTGDGVDNDCDGEVDEGCAACSDGATQDCYSGPAATEGRGACRGGTRTCSGGQFGACMGQVLPVAETCNNVDDDCDGTTDEDFGNKGAACSVGTGACASSGVFVCTGDGTGTTCNATAGNAGTEICNGVDDDCDGSVDENLTRACGTNQGICSTGTETCSNGSWGACSGATTAGTETCDGLDNDCDGSTDENITRSCGINTGACTTGVETCSNGSFGSCSGRGPVSETCNGIDDDCDGSTDENLSRSCGISTGACTVGTQTCSNGSFGTCSGQGPVTETCNGVDDDCDGSTDENFNVGAACTVGVGACQATGTRVCNSSGSGTTCNATPGNPAPGDLCGDNIDNDCDGQVDENCTSGCSGPSDCPRIGEECCADGLTGTLQCLPPIDPSGNRRLCVR